METDVVVVYSGGLDSSVLLYEMKHGGRFYDPNTDTMIDVGNPVAVSFVYGQRHGQRETNAARAMCHTLKIEHHVIGVNVFQGRAGRGNALTDLNHVAVPEGHYEDTSMKATVVPNRNMILLSQAAGFAIGIGSRVVAYGAHGGDHAIYPDCRKEFVGAMAEALRLCHYGPGVTLLAPYVDMTKADLVKRGHVIGVPFDLTWSCYKGGRVHCGKCGTCVERKEAFKLAGIDDRTEYEDGQP